MHGIDTKEASEKRRQHVLEKVKKCFMDVKVIGETYMYLLEEELT